MQCDGCNLKFFKPNTGLESITSFSVAGFIFMNIWENKDLKDLEGEIWKDIDGYFDVYQVSNFGRVKKIGRCDSKIETRFKSPLIMSSCFVTDGYLAVGLRKFNKKKTITVHKLVANAFIKKENINHVVNHKDGIKTNNHVDNLEWVTVAENNLHAYRVLGKKAPDKKGKENKLSKKIFCYNNNSIYFSTTEVGRIFNINPSSVSKVCRGVYTHTHGYKFAYLEEIS